jgi:hypothetical protein
MRDKLRIGYKNLQNPDFARKYDFDVRKHLHVKLFTKTKNELKVVAHRMDLSMQEIFERLAQCIIDEDPYIIRMLNEYKLGKENDESKNFFSDTDADTLLDTIQRNSPLKDNDD